MPNALLPACLLGLLAVTSACYIHSCPQGGKRATLSYVEVPECMACGPEDKGRCFGPNICCGEELGCFMGTPETERCLEEVHLPMSCQSGHRLCGDYNDDDDDEEMYCAAKNICCSEKSCRVDPECM